MLNRHLISTAIGATLALGSGLAAGKGDPLYALAPYVVKDTNRTTVVSVVMGTFEIQMHNEAPAALDFGSPSLHLQYWTKSTTAAHTDACKSSSVEIPVTPNDIVSFDTAGLFGGALFNDTTNPAEHGFSIGAPAPQHGYLFIESGGTFVVAVRETAQTEAGLGIRAVYWHELDLANGAAVGDRGQPVGSSDLTANGFPLDWQSVLAPDTIEGGEADLGPATPVQFFPPGAVMQSWTVTPLGKDMLNSDNNTVHVQTFKADGKQGAYDRNENEVDGVDPIGVRCVAKIPASQLLGRVYTRATWADEGGWAFLANLGDGDENYEWCCNGTTGVDLDAIVYQVDSGTLQGKFMANATRIASGQGPNPIPP